jgi:hypothetical protein
MFVWVVVVMVDVHVTVAVHDDVYNIEEPDAETGDKHLPHVRLNVEFCWPFRRLVLVYSQSLQ